MFDESDKHRFEAQLEINQSLRNEITRLREAVRSERESCAKIAENYKFDWLQDRDGRKIAEQIRARNEKAV